MNMTADAKHPIHGHGVQSKSFKLAQATKDQRAWLEELREYLETNYDYSFDIEDAPDGEARLFITGAKSIEALSSPSSPQVEPDRAIATPLTQSSEVLSNLASLCIGYMAAYEACLRRQRRPLV
jgi:hypothetical protein